MIHSLLVSTLLLSAPFSHARTVTIQDLDGFVGITEEDTLIAKKLIGMDLPKASWTKGQLQQAIKYSERIIWDCSQQITAIDLNPALFAHAVNLKEDLEREREVAVLIRNLAHDALQEKH